MAKYLVGIDEGTMSCKTCVFDLDGNLITCKSREYACYSQKPGYVEQDIEEIKTKVFESCKDAIEASGVNPKDIIGVGFSNQGITHVLVDENGNHLRNRTIGWQDVRHAEMLAEIRAQISEEDFYNICGVPLGAYNTACLNWLQKYEPDMWKKVYKCCSHQDYFLKQLGAEGYFIDEASANFTSMLSIDTAEWDSHMCEIYNVRTEQLPTVVHKPGQIVGHVTEDVSKLTGLPVGCNICVGALDVNSCSLAAGGIVGGVSLMIIGTAGVSVSICDEQVRDPHLIIATRKNHGMPNYVLFAMTHTAASSFRWFRDTLCDLEVALGRLLDDDPYNIMTQIASKSRPNANGVTALVCFQGVHVHRNNDFAKGSFLGIDLGTTKADIAQAILEGICFEMYSILRLKEELGGKISVVRLCGGAAKSPYWCQMFSDIMRKPIELTAATELGSLGAAMYAGVGSGVYADCNEAVEKCVHITKRYMPNPATFEAYEKSYARWAKAYDALNKSFYTEKE